MMKTYFIVFESNISQFQINLLLIKETLVFILNIIVNSYDPDI